MEGNKVMERVSQCKLFSRPGLVILFYVVVIVSFLVFNLWLLQPAWAQGSPPIIYSVSPQSGISGEDTLVTIYGENLRPDTIVNIYGEGPTLEGSYDTPGYANEVYVKGNKI